MNAPNDTQNDARTPVTVLGLGAMGRALAAAFLRAGHPTTVWNRTPGRAGELLAQGATPADTAAEAVAAAPLVIVCVLDYDAAHAILEPIGARLSGRVLVNLTSDTRSGPGPPPPGRPGTASTTSTARSWCRPRSSGSPRRPSSTVAPARRSRRTGRR
ncbi:NAD(P)-binding domain-containing protein [Streptomyces endophytica]|uniref:NAD(P)-binding domain-containing protein n=1 Tax=Streptomyces endophytica TaxID=2991496 RepID=UPI00311ABD71